MSSVHRAEISTSQSYTIVIQIVAGSTTWLAQFRTMSFSGQYAPTCSCSAAADEVAQGCSLPSHVFGGEPAAEQVTAGRRRPRNERVHLQER